MAQMRYLFKNVPKVARKWADDYGIPDNLPDHINVKKSIKPKKKRGK
jgi:hypothetical protein